MNANDCFLTIVISFKGKKFEIKSENLISIEDIKQRAIKEFNILKEELKNIQLTYINQKNQKCLINNNDDIIVNAIEINEDNYILELELSIEQAEKNESDKYKEKLKQVILSKVELKKENERIKKELDLLKNKIENKYKKAFIIFYNENFTIKNNENKNKKLKEEINILNKKINQKNQEFLKTKEENKSMYRELRELKNQKILNDVINENKITQLNNKVNELNDKIDDLNEKNKKSEIKSVKLKNIIEKIKDDKFDIIFNDLNSEKDLTDSTIIEEEENYYEYKDLIKSIEYLKKKQKMKMEKMEENYNKKIENSKEIEMKLKKENEIMLVENKQLSYSIQKFYLVMIMCSLFYLILILFFIVGYNK